MKRKDMLLTGEIKKHQISEGIRADKVAKVLGIHPKTYSRKVNHPELFTYLELIVLFDLLKFSDAEKAECI